MRRVAVVGSGVAGLAAAWRLATSPGERQVTLFEAGAYFGGHANTVDLTLDGVTHGVDTGFLVFNERTYPLLIQLLQALNFIHQRGFVHRDIKPANARVRPDGRLVLMDFGLMTAAGQAAGRAVTGTAGYLAPEVAVGGAIDGATDLYAVGCLAFELITGRLPFQGSLIEVVRQHVSARPPALRSLRPDVPMQLELLVMRLLEKQPQARYRSAEAVLADLSSLAGVGLARETEDQQRSFLVAGGLVGRDAELAVLTGALADCAVVERPPVMEGRRMTLLLTQK